MTSNERGCTDIAFTTSLAYQPLEKNSKVVIAKCPKLFLLEVQIVAPFNQVVNLLTALIKIALVWLR